MRNVFPDNPWWKNCSSPHISRQTFLLENEKNCKHFDHIKFPLSFLSFPLWSAVCSLHSAVFILHFTPCRPSVVRSPQFVLHWRGNLILLMTCHQFSVRGLHSAVCTLQFVVCSLQSPVCGLQFCSFQSVVCSLHAVCSLQSAVVAHRKETYIMCHFFCIIQWHNISCLLFPLP